MSDSSLDNHDVRIENLPNELVLAIERARARTASPAMVEQLTARVLKMTAAESVSNADQADQNALRNTRLYWLCALAASISALVCFKNWPLFPSARPRFESVELLTQPVYSPITTISLTQVGYQQIEEDLDRADAQVEEVSEGLVIASVRQEIQKTLDEFYDWSK